MTIVQLDSYASNPGDLSIESLLNIDGCHYIGYDRTAPEDVIERAKGAEIVLINKVEMTREVMASLPRLRYIGVLATGYNVVDVVAAREMGIVVTNIPAYSTMSVAQCVFAHLLNITQAVAAHDALVKQGKWQYNPDFCFFATPLIELAGKTMAIVGLGNTGMATARIALAFGMKVLAYTSKTDLPDGIEATHSYEELFRRADVLSLHCPLTPQTRHLVNAERLSLMKPQAIIINTGRGPLVDEAALADALRQGRVLAAGVDVLSQEPPEDGSPLIGLDNCFVTPHIAWGTIEARKRLLDVTVENIRAFLAGKPQNVVS